MRFSNRWKIYVFSFYVLVHPESFYVFLFLFYTFFFIIFFDTLFLCVCVRMFLVWVFEILFSTTFVTIVQWVFCCFCCCYRYFNYICMSPILFFRWFLRYLFIHSVSQPYVYSCILLVIYSFILSLVSLVTLSYFVCVRENCERDATLVLTKPKKVAEECRNGRKNRTMLNC